MPIKVYSVDMQDCFGANSAKAFVCEKEMQKWI